MIKSGFQNLLIISLWNNKTFTTFTPESTTNNLPLCVNYCKKKLRTMTTKDKANENLHTAVEDIRRERAKTRPGVKELTMYGSKPVQTIAQALVEAYKYSTENLFELYEFLFIQANGYIQHGHIVEACNMLCWSFYDRKDEGSSAIFSDLYYTAKDYYFDAYGKNELAVRYYLDNLD